jgi:hypothetical protein
MFFVLSVIGLLIRTPIFALFSGPMVALVETLQYGVFAGLISFATDTLHISIEQLGLNLALAVAVLVVLFWNFFSNRFITYGDVKFEMRVGIDTLPPPHRAGIGRYTRD